MYIYIYICICITPWQNWRSRLCLRLSLLSFGLDCHLGPMSFTYVFISLLEATRVVLGARGSPSAWTISGARRNCTPVVSSWVSVLSLSLSLSLSIYISLYIYIYTLYLYSIYTYICMYRHIHIYIYIYIYREREIFTYIYIYTYSSEAKWGRCKRGWCVF